jgi:hypothetical protein
MGFMDRVKAALTTDTEPPPTLPDVWPTEPNPPPLTGVDCVGEGHHHDGIKAVLGKDKRTEGVAVLLPEPTNPHDRNAVGVYIDRHKVGHLPQDQARALHKQIRERMGAGEVISVQAEVINHGRGKYQVIVDPSSHGPMSRPRIAQALLDNGNAPRTEAKAGFIVKHDRYGFRVLRAGDGSIYTRDEHLDRYVETLRSAGYQAQVGTEDKHRFVAVTAHR